MIRGRGGGEGDGRIGLTARVAELVNKSVGKLMRCEWSLMHHAGVKVAAGFDL